MNFDKELIEKQGYGNYVPLDTSRLPNLYIAYRTDLSEISDVFHNNIRARFNAGDKTILDAMKFWGDITEEALACLNNGNFDELSRLMNANFDRRASIYKISDGNLRMVEVARACGACAKFTGSGGAIVGIYKDDKTYSKLVDELAKISVEVFKPNII